MAKNTTIIKARYDATHMKPYYFKFHIVNDADIIDKLSKVDSRQDYIRQLIREDITRTCSGSVPVPLSDATLETLKEKAAQCNISVPDLIKNIVNECIIRDMRKNIDSVPVSVPDSVSKNSNSVPDSSVITPQEKIKDVINQWAEYKGLTPEEFIKQLQESVPELKNT